MKHLILLTGCLLAVNLFAQPTARPVSLAEALDLALSNSAQIKKAQLDREALELRLKEGRAAALPQINAGLGLDYFPVLPTQFLPAELFGGPGDAYVPATFGQPWQLAGTVRVEQQIYNEAGRRMAPAANTSRALLDLLSARSEEEVLYNTATVFFQAQQTEQLQRSVSANLEKLKTLQRMAELQYKNDYATSTDVRRIQMARTNLETQQYNLNNGIRALHQTLQFLCGIPLDETINPVQELANPAADSARWMALALEPEASTEYRLLQRQTELLRIQAHSLRAGNIPQLSAYAAGAFQNQGPNPNFFESSRRWYGLAALGLKVDIPIFDGFRRRTKIEQISLESLKIEEDRQVLVRAKNLEFYQARDQFLGAIQMLRTQEENVALARDITDKLTLQYKEGVAPLSDLLNTQTAKVEAETHYWQQVFGYKLAVLRLLKATGQIRQITQANQ